ncbi:MAG: hypothetical protein IJ060_01720 [Oscillospiraceae bacterium]|nr:hypothetical protein [Oscillospiraceae bacterium]
MKQIQAEEQDVKIYIPARHQPAAGRASGQSVPETDEVLSLWEPSRPVSRQDSLRLTE